MTHDQFRRQLDVLGADMARWPLDERMQAETLIATDAAAHKMWSEARRIDSLIVRQIGRRHTTEPTAMWRVLTELNKPLPPQKGAAWNFRPAMPKLPQWKLPQLNLAPAWPRAAALAACAALGFFVGLSGVDRYLESATAGYAVAASSDFSATVFDPEPLTGALP